MALRATYAQVVFALPVPHGFTYSVPQELAECLCPGTRVLAPLGGRTREGVVVALLDQPDVPRENVLPLNDCLDDGPFFTDELLGLCRWVADYYLCSWGEALHAAVPAGARVIAQRRVWRTDAATSERTQALRRQAPRQAAILDALRKKDGRTVQALQEAVGQGAVYSSVARLESAGLVRVQEHVRRGVGARMRLAARLLVTVGQAERTADEVTPIAPKQAALLRALCSANADVSVARLLRGAHASRSALNALQAKGLVAVESREERRDPLEETVAEYAFSTRPLAMNADQQAALDAVRAALDAGATESLLLYGVTGSGKTEVYLQAVRRVLDGARSALLLVPEIALTPQTVSRFVARFGPRVAVLHSRLSGGERYDEWRRVRDGGASIVVGPRSAVFAPLRRLGIVIVDEEHESSYKQDDPAPRYDAREVARRRAEGAGAVLLLGSATPSLESIHAVRSGRMRVLRLPQRVNGIALPPVHVSDMREELRRGNRTVFSDRLRQAIVHRLAQREQTMLLLNRRGFSTYVFCRDCGHVELCPNCRVSLTYHQRAPFRRPHGERRADARDGAGVLVCHHCLHVRPTPTRCRECGGQRIRYLGLGTQQVEEETRAAFPDARVARMDTDTTARKGSHGRILAAFRDGQYDILIGTQMIAKGLDFPNVTLVGVILAETSLFLPDFRAAERAFCLLTQVAGRSGRSPKGGEVVFQTYRPDHYSIAAAQRHDYDAFCEMELPQRDEHHYPPFTHALRVLVRGDDENAVIEAARQLGDALADVGDGEEGADTLLVRGPAPAPLARLRGQYRWHLLLRAERPQALRERALAVLEKVPPATHASVAIVLDMDPVSLL